MGATTAWYCPDIEMHKMNHGSDNIDLSSFTWVHSSLYSHGTKCEMWVVIISFFSPSEIEKCKINVTVYQWSDNIHLSSFTQRVHRSLYFTLNKMWNERGHNFIFSPSEIEKCTNKCYSASCNRSVNDT